MRKQLINDVEQSTSAVTENWLNLDELAEVEISSEDAAHPIEAALLPGGGNGWRAAVPGQQTIRLIFAQPQQLSRIRIRFVETAVQRTQEYLLRWSADGGQSFREIVRQQWNFNPHDATLQSEEHAVNLAGVGVLELVITPDIGSAAAFATLAELRLA